MLRSADRRNDDADFGHVTRESNGCAQRKYATIRMSIDSFWCISVMGAVASGHRPSFRRIPSIVVHRERRPSASVPGPMGTFGLLVSVAAAKMEL